MNRRRFLRTRRSRQRARRAMDSDYALPEETVAALREVLPTPVDERWGTMTRRKTRAAT